MADYKFPTEMVDLPSKGYFYFDGHPLSSGKVEVKYMTAKEEDILTSTNLIEQGIVIDKLLESLIVDKNVKVDDLLIGDKNAIMIAARILGYGKDYEFKAINPLNNQIENFTIDLTTLKDKNLNPKDLKEEGLNEFDFTLPTSKNLITFKLLTHGDENSIDRELQGLKKLKKETLPEASTRLKYIITSVDGDREKKTIREFVDNYLLAKDARALREKVRQVSPDIDLKYVGDEGEEVSVPINANFFWPDSTI